MKERIKIFDTTLRDGEQSPGGGVGTKKEYIKILKEISKTRIDIIEAGFPSANSVAFDRVYTASKMAGNGEIGSDIAGLCQLREDQVKKTIEALLPAGGKGLLHTYFPVDPNLKKASVGNVDDEKIIENTYEYIKMAKNAGLQAQFSPEGYSRQGENFDFTTELIKSAVKAGVDFINCPDTIGGSSKYEGEKYFVNDMIKHKEIIDDIFPGNKVIWSMHNHNDYGLAVENSINGIVDGIALKVEGTIGGIGERAGNTDLIQVIMILKHFLGDKYDLSHIDTRNFKKLGKLVSDSMLQIQSHYPHVGENSSKHTSGGHTNAIKKNPTVYQPYNPEEVGGKIKLVFGPLSGGGLAMDIIEKGGYICKKEESAEIGQFIKEKSKDRYKGITDEELIEIYKEYRSPIILDGFTIEGKVIIFKGKIFGENNVKFSFKETAFKSFSEMINSRGYGITVDNYSSASVDKGVDSNTETSVELTIDGKKYTGKDISNDIELSSLRALLNAFNTYYIDKNFKKQGKIL